ncbi:MAG: hypothetical protein Q4F72_12410, partial [Desulfovibrionaceae bacterium]|nr:hypothetical protein [Desulfovibrionaceae bacterium]
VFDSEDLVIDGGSGVDMLLGRSSDMPTLAELLAGGEGAPQVSDIEILLSGDALADVSNRGDVVDLLQQSGADIDTDSGSVSLGEGWSLAATPENDFGTQTWQYSGDDLQFSLETTLPVSRSDGFDAEIAVAVQELNTAQG